MGQPVVYRDAFMSWKIFEQKRPDLAEFGKERLHRQVAYLATVRKDGSPRVHPVTPMIAEGRLLVFMEPTSPKGHDLRRDGRYAIHSSVADNEGTTGEFIISGRAQMIEDPSVRAVALRLVLYTPAEQYILFEFDVESASSTTYDHSQPVRTHWKRGL